MRLPKCILSEAEKRKAGHCAHCAEVGCAAPCAQKIKSLQDEIAYLKKKLISVRSEV